MAGSPVSPAENLGAKPDRRFEAEAWTQFPFNVYARAYQNNLALMNEAVRDVCGVTDYHTQLLEFALRTLLNAASPSNFLASNPELLALTRAQQGQNLVRGFGHLVEDIGCTLEGGAPAGSAEFEVGRNVAVTPGKVVCRDELIELIQYQPVTKDAYAEPVMIVPAWVMKYYILGLSARNSMVKYLVDQGHTVFMMSWKNPDESDRDLAMDDYLEQGLRTALDAVCAIVPRRKVHAVAIVSVAPCSPSARRHWRATVTSGWPRSRCSPRRPIFPNRASSPSSSIRASWRCSKQRCTVRACSRAGRWVAHSRCCAPRTCCGSRS